MTHAETLSHVLHGIRTGQIIAWLDDDGEIRLSNAEQATAAQWSARLSAPEVMALAESCEFQRVLKTRAENA